VIMDALNVLREFTEKNPAPWRVCLWTIPEDGSDPQQKTAGYYSILATVAYFPDQDHGMMVLHRGAEGELSINPNGITSLPFEIPGGICIPYQGFIANTSGFIKETMITITKESVEDDRP